MLPDDLPDELDSDDDQAPEGKRHKAQLSPNLSGKQRRFLRALGHRLSAVVQIGKDGITAPLVKNAAGQLHVHELIKVKVGEGSPVGRHQAAEELAAATQSELAQVLGRTFLLYKARAERPEIKLPR